MVLKKEIRNYEENKILCGKNDVYGNKKLGKISTLQIKYL